MFKKNSDRIVQSLLVSSLILVACDGPTSSDIKSEDQAALPPMTKFEEAQPDEARVTADMTEVLRQSIEKAYVDKGERALRDAHPKTLGCVKATFNVLSSDELAATGFPADHRVGLFQPGLRYDALIRYSNASGQVKSDAEGDGRGMAIKLLGVPGKKLHPVDFAATTHDLVMINHPVFPTRDAQSFFELVKASSAGDPMSYFFPSKLKPWTWRLKDFANANALRQSKPANVLAERFFSQTPYLLKDTPIKFSAKPCSPLDVKRPDPASDNYLSEELAAYLSDKDVCLDFFVQYQKPGMPIEDAREEWSESKSPFIKVATLNIPSQVVATPEKNLACDQLSFNPWHALPEHQPLGSINRSRRSIYNGISEFRHKINGEVKVEPTSLGAFQ